MSWRDRYIQASFRGVDFQVKKAGTKLGKRIQQHVFPGRNDFYPEEHGKAPPEFTLTWYILGEDYDLQRQKLEEICVKAGDGELAHPYRGVLRVQCLAINTTEVDTENRIARGTMTFIDSGKNLYPSVVTDPASAVAESGESAKDSVVAAFVEEFTVDGFPAFVAESAEAQLTAAADAIENSTSFLFGESDSLTDLSIAISDIKNNTFALVRTPGSLSDSIRQSVDLLMKATGNNVESLRSALGLTSFGDEFDEIPETTPSRAQQNSNQSAMNRLMENISLSAGSQQAAVIDYESSNDAIAVSELLVTTIDDKQEGIISDDEYEALQNLRAEVVNALPPEDEELPFIREYTPPATISSINISQFLYGNPDKETDVVNRNSIRHPGFITGRKALEVLSNE